MRLPASIRRPRAATPSLAVVLLALACLPAVVRAEDPATATAEPEAGLKVPPLPQGTPEEVIAFIEGLLPPKVQPKSQEEMFEYLRGVSRVTVEAVDKVLPAVKADDPLHDKAARLKMESLMRLWQLGDEPSGKELAAFTATLAAGTGELAAEAGRLNIAYEAQQMMSSGSFDAAPAIVKKAADLLTANPDDVKTAGLVVQLCGGLERANDGGKTAAAAFETFAPILASSSDPRIKHLAESFAGRLRLMSLAGKPMEISGRLLDDTPFDLKSLEGKVVLVDFWATWCGPCIAEIPNVIAQYEKYHDKGFEVVGVSLDQDRDGKTAKEQITDAVTHHKIPWPILMDGARLAQHYGITGIPQLILIGRDGNVITLNARGPRLAEELEKLFKDG